MKTQSTPVRRGPFLFTFGLMFVFSLSAANTVGFVPYYVDGTEPGDDGVALWSLPQLGDEADTTSQQPAEPTVPAFVPERITSHAIGLDLPVLNPSTTNVAALDEELKSGVVRYPGSAKPGEQGNVLIFGHSSHLPVVHNQMYRAFNNLPELAEGDFVTLEGGGYAYLYRVTEVRKTDANEEYIDLSAGGGKKLTLSTCDTFGAKSSRWVVEADFVSAYPLGA